MSSAIQQIAARLVRLERNAMAQATTPALAHSSIEDGGSIDSNADDGKTMAQYGGQFDGSFMAASLVGPTPPTPSAPIVTAAIGGLTVRWDGLFTNADFAPMDFTRVEVHVSTNPAFVPNEATTLVATIESPRGALPFVARAIGTYYVAFVARSQSGKAGPASDTTGPTVVALIDNDALTSPVYPKIAHAEANNFALSTSMVEKLRTTITVPAGYTKALVIATANMTARNTTAGPDNCFIGVEVNGVSSGWATMGYASSTNYAHGSSTTTALLTGLGASFYVIARAGTMLANWSADLASTLNIDVMVVFLR